MATHPSRLRVPACVAVVCAVCAAAPLVRANHVTPPLASDLVLWYEPDDPDGATTDGLGRVSSLSDQSGRGNNAGTFAGANSPLLAANALNGRTALQYTTNNEGLRVQGALGIAPQSGWTYFLVVRPETFSSGAMTDGNGTYFIDRDLTATGNPLASLKVAATDKYGFQVRYDDNTGLGGPVSTTPVSTSGVQIVTWKRNYDGVPDGNDQFELYVNNVLEGVTADIGTNLTPQPPQIGRHATIAVGGYTGLQGDFMIYGRALNAAEQLQVYEFLNAKYVPEPGAAGIFGAAAIGLLRRRRSNSSRP